MSAVIGFSVRSFLPPFVVDDDLWREMLVGPPLAGAFAVVAASIAFFPAFRSARIAQDNAAREQWWKRAEWALARADSTNHTGREVANDALTALSDEATETEFAMVVRTINNLQDLVDLDTTTEPRENGGWRRLVPWVNSAR
ncbi:hypothetical protein ACEXQD_06725 [Herbiconiux sp. P15]|uniref:hypothetical protein n=1 Tax=Herbiconiux liukaitaii TaxID=3342799 RepID=UPI0035B86216